MQTKKSLFAFAVTASFCGAAFAQASITIYGITDVSMRRQINPLGSVRTSGAPGGNTWSMVSGWANGSRIGFKGVEDLGGGSNAHFVLESGFSIDTGAVSDSNSLFNRSAYVGVGGAWGTLDMGRQYSVAFKTMTDYDPFRMQYSSLIPLALVTPGSPGSSGCLPLTGGGCARFNNDVQYSGTFGNVTARAEYAFGEVAGSTRTGAAQAVGLRYASGPLSAGGAYTQQKTAADFDKQAYTVGAAYSIGPVRISLGYNNDKAETATVDTKIKSAWGGLSYQITPAFTLTGAYYQTKVSSAVSATRPTGKEKSDFYMIEAKYALSKRTSLYAEIDRNKWSRGIFFLPTTAPGVTQTGVSVGINHRF
ncbi:porin [Herbaspirillum sp. GCM10030257]|uniref:porin n=1 Tax=Herbaspirillum sp. GCM10030257 TaxID=3273393 RepID=UPI00361D3D00